MMVNFEVLEKKMKAKGHTVMSLERAANISNGVIGKWKTSSPNIETLLKVADVLECKVDDLVTKDAG